MDHECLLNTKNKKFLINLITLFILPNYKLKYTRITRAD